MLLNEGPHHVDTARILLDFHDDAATSQEFLFAHERDILAHDNVLDPVEQDRSRTHRTGG